MSDFITRQDDPRLSDLWQPDDPAAHSDLLHISLCVALSKLSAFEKEVERMKGAIRRIYTTQMYEDKIKESGVSVEMVSAILDAASIAGVREET